MLISAFNLYRLRHFASRLPFLCRRFISHSSDVQYNDVIQESTLEILNVKYDRDEWTNITPKIISYIGQNLIEKKSNPLSLVAQNIRHFFTDFDTFSFPSPVVDLEANFDSLLIDKNHVSRTKSQSYYVNSNYLLRSHTSAHQAHCLKRKSTSFVCIADVYRRDEVNRSHFPAFHQCEILRLYSQNEHPFRSNNIEVIESTPTLRSENKQEFYKEKAHKVMESIMKSTIEEYIRQYLGKSIEMRWVPAFFPFTHPSWELEIFSHGEWLEILGAGIVEHKLLAKVGIEDKIGWALGFGLERLAMIKYKIPDIRLFWIEDERFLSQFENRKHNEEVIFQHFSLYPPRTNDLSFWLPPNANFCENDFYDLVRTVGGDAVEEVTLIDDYLDKKTNRVSNCFRIAYRSCFKLLRQEDINDTHLAIAEAARKQFGVELRL